MVMMYNIKDVTSLGLTLLKGVMDLTTEASHLAAAAAADDDNGGE